MRTMLFAAAALLSLGAAADARPFVVVEPAVAPPLLRVAGGCGLGFHRGPYGGCIRNGGVIRVFPRYVVHCGPHWTRFGWRGGCRY